MYKIIENSEDLDLMYETLKSDGVFVIPNYLNEKDNKQLSDEMLKRLEKSKRKYEFGKSYRGDYSSIFNEDSPLKKVYDVTWMKKLTKMYKPKSSYGECVFSTHDYISTNKWERQAWLHFDKQNSLKFFIYLTDVEEGCGALTVAPKTHILGRELRTKWSGSEYEKKRRLENTIQTELKNYEIQPIYQPKGSLIVFDTDTFHKGGVVNKNKNRLVVRLHCK